MNYDETREYVVSKLKYFIVRDRERGEQFSEAYYRMAQEEVELLPYKCYVEQERIERGIKDK